MGQAPWDQENRVVGSLRILRLTLFRGFLEKCPRVSFFVADTKLGRKGREAAILANPLDDAVRRLSSLKTGGNQ